MRKFAFGGWAVRFLAAAGVSGVACGGSVTSVEPGDAGTAGRSGGAGETGSAEGGHETLVDETGMGAGDTAAPASGGETGSGGSETSGVASSGSPSGGADGFDPSAPRFACTDPQPYANAGSGLEICANGMLHRASVGQCVAPPAGGFGCQVDDDCPSTAAGGGTICRCNQQGYGECVAAGCSTDADCDEGLACLGTGASCQSEALIFSCQVPDDSCGPCISVTDACLSFGEGLSCQYCHGAAGRPFLIDALPRTAPTVPGSAWLDGSIAFSTPALTREARARLTAHWLRQAELEHASVAAFARFVLELLSLGAPPDFVSAATEALTDETAHARSCYAVASSYAQQPLGPSQLDVGGALGELGLGAIVTRAVLEGCVAETLAAIEASEAASLTSDSAVRQLLSRIAEDEARHADLSWRFLRWALSRGDGSLRDVARRAFEGARDELSARSQSASSSAVDGELLLHGVLPARLAARLALEAFDAVIVPCAQALVSPHGSVQSRVDVVLDAGVGAGGVAFTLG